MDPVLNGWAIDYLEASRIVVAQSGQLEPALLLATRIERHQTDKFADARPIGSFWDPTSVEERSRIARRYMSSAVPSSRSGRRLPGVGMGAGDEGIDLASGPCNERPLLEPLHLAVIGGTSRLLHRAMADRHRPMRRQSADPSRRAAGHLRAQRHDRHRE